MPVIPLQGAFGATPLAQTSAAAFGATRPAWPRARLESLPFFDDSGSGRVRQSGIHFLTPDPAQSQAGVIRMNGWDSIIYCVATTLGT